MSKTPRPFYVPVNYKHGVIEETTLVEDFTGDEYKDYVLTPIQRCFVLFEHPSSCILGMATALLTGSVIVINVGFLIASTCPSFQATPLTCTSPVCDNDPSLCAGRTICKPIPAKMYSYVEAACILCFTVQYAVRVLTVWAVPPRIAGVTSDSTCQMPVLWLMIRYLLKWENIVDFCAIVPPYIILAKVGGELHISQNFGFIRVLWLPKLFKIFAALKGSSAVGEIFFKTLTSSAQALIFTFFFITIGTIVFASIMYELESGNFRVTADFPNGAYLRRVDILGDDNERTLFSSIPVAVYFTVITTTSLGYGDIVPRTAGGLSVACFLCIFGVGTLALSIAVIGGNFAALFDAYTAKLEARKDQKSSEKESPQRYDSVQVSAQHDRQCYLFAEVANEISEKAIRQADAFTRATALLGVIIERHRREKLTRAMIRVGDYRILRHLHRSQQPASIEQIKKWNAPTNSFGASYKDMPLEDLSAKGPLKPPTMTEIIIDRIRNIPRWIEETLPQIHVPGTTWMVPRIYVHRSPTDLYFPEVHSSRPSCHPPNPPNPPDILPPPFP